MAQAPGYRSQVGPARPASLPRASAAAFGAGIGDAVADIGGALHRRDVTAYQIERQNRADSEAADFNRRFALLREEADKASIDGRANAAAGGAGHVEGIAKWWEEKTQGLADGIADERVRRSAEAQLQEFGARFRSSEYSWAEGARVNKLVTDQRDTTAMAANRARRGTTGEAFQQELTIGRAAIEAMPGVPADIREALIKEHDGAVAVGFLNGVVERSPKAIDALLASGQFDDLVSPAEQERLRNGAGVEIRRIDAEARAQAAAQKAEIRERLSTLNAQLSAGVEIPDDQLAEAERLATSIGDESGAFKLSATRVQAGLNRETKSWRPEDWDANINRLEALGAKRSPQQSIELQHLRQIAPSRITEFRQNPGRWMATNGAPPPALDFNQAGSLDRRLEWARSASRATNRPVDPLLPNEAEQLREQAEASPKARVEVAGLLARFGGRAAVQAAKQVAPNDALLARLVLMRGPDRAAAANGAEARKANPAIIDGKMAAEARAAFDERTGGALSLMGPADVAAVLETAKSLYAERAARGAIPGFEQRKDDANFNVHIHRALGGTRDADGNYRGGIGMWGSSTVLLPDRLSQSMFETRLSRMNWSDKWQGAPVFSNGRAMTPAQLRGYRPVQRPDGRYEFHGRTPDEVVQRRGGGIWTVSIDEGGVHP